MRIAHVTDCYLPRLGGIETQVHDLAGAQRSAGHEVRVLTATAATLQDAMDSVDTGDTVDAGVRRCLMGPPALGTLFQGQGQGQGQGQRILPDAVHAHTSIWSPFTWRVVDQAVRVGIPVLLTQHSVLPSQTSVLHALGRTLPWRRWPARWTAVSEVAAAPLRRLLNGPEVSLLPNTVDGAWWRSHGEGAMYQHRAPELTLISVGRFVARKRPAALVGILQDIRRRVPAGIRLRAVLVGDGPRLPAVRRELGRRGMSRWVQLTGRCDRTTVRALMHRSDVYVAPARLESFGLAALEARCAGLPVVAMAAGGIGDFVRHGVEGYLVESDAEMAGWATHLLTHPRLMAQMRRAARRPPPACDWELAVERSLAEYHLAVESLAGCSASRAWSTPNA